MIIHSGNGPGEIVFEYKGIVDQDFILGMMGGLDDYFERHKLGAKYRRDVMTVLNESLHNIDKHGAPDATGANIATLAIKNSVNGFIFTMGNFIAKTKLDEFKSKLDRMLSLSIEELKQEYRENLFKGELNDNQGAGLGLLSIAIKSKKGFEYSFQDIDEEKVFFFLVVATEKDGRFEI